MIRKIVSRFVAKEKRPGISSEIYSDGYHTFDELYEHRDKLFLALCKCMPELAWMSRVHHDGGGYPHYFLIGLDLPNGTITYHLHDRWWLAAQRTGATVLERGKKWDGHTSSDVLLRIEEWIHVAEIKSS